MNYTQVSTSKAAGSAPAQLDDSVEADPTTPIIVPIASVTDKPQPLLTTCRTRSVLALGIVYVRQPSTLPGLSKRLSVTWHAQVIIAVLSIAGGVILHSDCHGCLLCQHGIEIAGLVHMTLGTFAMLYGIYMIVAGAYPVRQQLLASHEEAT